MNDEIKGRLRKNIFLFGKEKLNQLIDNGRVITSGISRLNMQRFKVRYGSNNRYDKHTRIAIHEFVIKQNGGQIKISLYTWESGNEFFPLAIADVKKSGLLSEPIRYVTTQNW